MSLSIRLQRNGSHKRPHYHIVVADRRAARNGRFVEQIGIYDPMIEENRVVVTKERAEFWLSQGARASDRVSRLLNSQGFKLPVAKLKPAREAAAKAKAEAEAKAAAEAKVKAEAEAKAKAEAAKAEAKAAAEAAKAAAAAAPAEEAAPAGGETPAAE